jgi:hypothetical protein
MAAPRYSPFEQIINKQKEQIRHQENSSRLAHSFGEFETVGWGEFAFSDSVVFESPYLYRPSVSYGWSLKSDDDAEELRTSRYPRASGGVLRWDIDHRGLYRGAWCAVTVEDRSALIAPTDPDPDPTYNIIHDFTFLGIMSKDLLPFMRNDGKEV